MAGSRRLLVKVDDDLYGRLSRASDETGLSLGEIVRRALTYYLDYLERVGAVSVQGKSS